MLNIGLITIIDDNNYGNRLQNYAVQIVLNKFNLKCETVKNTPLFNTNYVHLNIYKVV